MESTSIKIIPSNIFEGSVDATKEARIAVLICSKSKSYINAKEKKNVDTFQYDDILLNKSFKEHNLIYDEVIWDDKSVCWTDYDVVLIRSTWDYHEGKLNQFLNTLEAIEKSGVALYNSYKTIKWNCQKTYLNDLSKRDVSVIDTIYTTRDELPNLETELISKGWTECILKPVISANAYKTFKAASPSEAQKIYNESYDIKEMVMIQPFANEIKEGEWSFIFFNGEYSHAVLKKPAEGDFKVQIFIDPKDKPTDLMIKDAENILKNVEDCINEVPLYTRIDTIKRNNKLFVMEIELIEPYLFLQTSDTAAEKLTLSLKNRLNYNKNNLI